ncbi:Alpha/Beta hydrolase protein [Mycena crocata]|nr:Alpha/Beta hydrolase protein [Mycena crocata]
MQSHTITTAPDTNLEVLTSIPATGSSKPALLFVHFWGGSSRTFSALAALLSPDFPLILPSLRGFGASTGPADADAYKVTDNGDDLVALVAQLQGKNPDLFRHGLVLIGHSMGGKIVQVLAARGDFGALLKGLVLIGPAPIGRLELPAEMREQQIVAYASRESAERALKGVLLGSDVGVEALGRLIDDGVGANEQARTAWATYGTQEDYETLVDQNLKISVAVVVGGLDKIETADKVNERTVKVLEKAGASVTMSVLEGVGHLMPVEAPKQLEQVIRNFLQ